MIRVLEVIRQGQIGGGESHLLDLVSFLDKNQIIPICLSFTDGEMIRRLNNIGVKCHVIHTDKPFDIKIQKTITQLIKTEGIQIIHAHGSRAASNMVWPARKLKIPLIYTVHGWSFHEDQSFFIKKLRALSEKYICHYSNDVICVSQSNASTGFTTFGLKSHHVIENGINLERFNPDKEFANIRSSLGFENNDFIVAFIARCTKQKNPISFLRALAIAHAENPSIKGLFVGEGDMDKEVNAYIDEHHMKAYLYRSPFRTDIPELLHTCDAYCLPSLWEGLSIALLEAMAMKKTIIATPTDGTCELIQSGTNGLIVPFNEEKALANAIIQLSKDREKCMCFGEAARQTVEKRFNAKRVAEQVTQIYKKNIL